MSNNSSNDSGFWFWVIVIGGIMLLGQAIGGNRNSSTPTSSSSSYSPTAPERVYVEQRFRNEGYSNAESQQAAEAVLKFHQAQQNRK